MKTITIASILAALAVLSACESEPQGELTLSTTSENMSSAGGEIRLKVTSNFRWTCNTGTENISFSSKSGDAGTSEILIGIPGNPSSDKRDILIKFNCENKREVLTVAQEGAVFRIISIEHSALLFSAPSFSGTGWSGTVNWGDNSSDEISPTTVLPIHSYKTQDKYTVTVNVHDSDEITLVSLGSVSKIDLSSF